ncbi:MAG: hypothetical protein J7647_32070 [Cyanobacteria bacterium SBLK]|nr:hypothetical protein [Cyanobacteria bacterium SBLK]
MKIFDWTASVVLIVLLMGILGGSVSGDRAFSLAPFFAFVNRLKGVDPYNVSQEPIADVANRAGVNLQKQAEEALAKAANGQTDPYLAVCRGTVDTTKIISYQKALQTKNANFRDLADVQAYLGMPSCVEGKKWRYRLQGGGLATIQETRSGVKVRVVR